MRSLTSEFGRTAAITLLSAALYLLYAATASADVPPTEVAAAPAFSPEHSLSAEELRWSQEVLTQLPPTWRAQPAGLRKTADTRPAESASALVDGNTFLIASGLRELAFKREVALGYALREDMRYEWSRRHEWRSINGWHRNTWLQVKPANISPSAFADERGKRSPALDLATAMAAYLVPEPNVRQADRSRRCTHLAHSRFIEAVLAEQNPSWLPPVKKRFPTCQAFTRWARLEALDGLEVLMAAPSPKTLGSLFGHIFLRVSWRTGDGPEPLINSRVVAFLAETRIPLAEDSLYAVKGVFGAYRAYLNEMPFLKVYHEYAVDERRDLTRFSLRLSPEETEELLARVWTARRHAAYRYYFFSDNCASLTIDLLNGVLPAERRIVYPEVFGSGPTGILDGLAFARAYDGGPLVERNPDTILSLQSEAAAAHALRDEVLAAMRSKVATDKPQERPRFDRAVAKMHSRRSAVRAEGYGELSELAAEADPSIAGQLLRESMRIEAWLSAEENLNEEKRAERDRRRRLHRLHRQLGEKRALLVGKVVAPGEVDTLLRQLDAGEATTRMTAYRDLADAIAQTATYDSEHVALLVFYLRIHAHIRRDESDLRQRKLFHRLFTSSSGNQELHRHIDRHAHLFAKQHVTRISANLRLLQQMQVTLTEVAVPDQNLSRQRLLDRDTADYHASGPHAGIDNFEIGMILQGDTAGELTPGFSFGGAVFDERIGDQRRHGFPGNASFTFLRSSTIFVRTSRGTVLGEGQSRVAGYRTLRHALDEHEPWTRLVGWEAYGDIARSQARDLAFRHDLGGAVLVPLFARNDYADHVLASVGLRYSGYYRLSDGEAHLAALPVALEARLALPSLGTLQHALSTRVEAAPLVDRWLGHGVEWSAQAEGHLPLWNEADFGMRQHVGGVLLLTGEWCRQPSLMTGAARLDTFRLRIGLRLE